ncbi:hypothetical protein M0657_003144 [Pyricularia oryzae]|nr:hypothetical protein M0657_003144 [Pyricularia oryzae]KAI7928207.1 hypothetical protein M9X92_001895 [Pyricularia oryzae]
MGTRPAEIQRPGLLPYISRRNESNSQQLGMWQGGVSRKCCQDDGSSSSANANASIVPPQSSILSPSQAFLYFLLPQRQKTTPYRAKLGPKVSRPNWGGKLLLTTYTVGSAERQCGVGDTDTVRRARRDLYKKCG